MRTRDSVACDEHLHPDGSHRRASRTRVLPSEPGLLGHAHRPSIVREFALVVRERGNNYRASAVHARIIFGHVFDFSIFRHGGSQMAMLHPNWELNDGLARIVLLAHWY